MKKKTDTRPIRFHRRHPSTDKLLPAHRPAFAYARVNGWPLQMVKHAVLGAMYGAMYTVRRLDAGARPLLSDGSVPSRFLLEHSSIARLIRRHRVEPDARPPRHPPPAESSAFKEWNQIRLCLNHALTTAIRSSDDDFAEVLLKLESTLAQLIDWTFKVYEVGWPHLPISIDSPDELSKKMLAASRLATILRDTMNTIVREKTRNEAGGFTVALYLQERLQANPEWQECLKFFESDSDYVMDMSVFDLDFEIKITDDGELRPDHYEPPDKLERK